MFERYGESKNREVGKVARKNDASALDNAGSGDGTSGTIEASGGSATQPISGSGGNDSINTQDSGDIDECAAISATVEQVEVITGGPVSLYIMLDQSRSTKRPVRPVVAGGGRRD